VKEAIKAAKAKEKAAFGGMFGKVSVSSVLIIRSIIFVVCSSAALAYDDSSGTVSAVVFNFDLEHRLNAVFVSVAVPPTQTTATSWYMLVFGV
jgi:hypothetical protein